MWNNNFKTLENKSYGIIISEKGNKVGGLFPGGSS